MTSKDTMEEANNNAPNTTEKTDPEILDKDGSLRNKNYLDQNEFVEPSCEMLSSLSTPFCPNYQHPFGDLVTSLSKIAFNNTDNSPQSNPDDFFEHFPMPLISFSPSNHTGLNLLEFITAGISNRLKCFGVDELECTEYLETWLSQRRQRLPYQSVQRPRAAAPSSKCSPTEQPFQTLLGLGNVIGGLASGIVNSETQTIFSPSQPNSSLLRLAGDGNIELGQFLSRIEEVRGHLNNATCTILQTTTLFVLPYMKLLAGQKLENACCEPFVDGWIQAIVRITGELKPESVGDEVDVMVTREFHALRTESQRLYKRMKKMFKRIKAPFDEHDRKSKKSLVKIHPKGGTSFITPKGRVDRRSKGNDAAPNNDLKDQEARLDSKTSVYFSPIPLSPRGTITLANLFKNHVYFSISKKEELMYKTEIDGEWQDFSTLPFGKRRDLFLSSIEDLRRTLKFPLIAAQQLKQLLIAGYPENITTNIRENLSYLKRISKQEDLLVLSKVTIGTQVNLLQECMDRLVRALHDTLKISKYFRDSIKSNCKARNVKCGVPISAANCIFPKEKYSRIITDVRLSLKFDNSPVKLMVPYSAPENSKGNAFPFY